MPTSLRRSWREGARLFVEQIVQECAGCPPARWPVQADGAGAEVVATNVTVRRRRPGRELGRLWGSLPDGDVAVAVVDRIQVGQTDGGPMALSRRCRGGCVETRG